MLPEFSEMDDTTANEALFTGNTSSDKLIMTFMSQLTKQNIRMISTQENLEKQIGHLVTSIDKLTTKNHAQDLHNEQVQSQIKSLIDSNATRKKENERVEEMAKKALNKCDLLSDRISDACDINSSLVTKSSKEYTDKEITTFEGKVKLGFMVAKIASSFAFILLTIIGWFILDKMDNIYTAIGENSKMIKENREQNLRTYDNLNAFKEHMTKDKK